VQETCLSVAPRGVCGRAASPHTDGCICQSVVEEKVAVRFRNFVCVNEATGCHEWTGALDRSGYGAFKVQGKKINAHRWAYMYAVGPIPKGLDLDHLCRIRKCVNVEHLEAVTRKINVRRGLAAGPRVTHCRHGHEYTDANTYRYPDGQRECKTCKYHGGRAE
jgi:hypothetical protein